VPTELSDIWGWVDSLGNEYAIVGTNEGTSIFDLSDPTNPTEIFFEQGMHSTWRDIKTFGDYAYVTTEATNGLLIIDLSPLPSSTNLPTYFYTGPTNAPWDRAHNLYIDEDRGYAYIFGANRGNKGCIILDLNQDPTQPVEVADIDDWYVHDGMSKGDTLYLANVSDGFFSIWDVSTPSNPVLMVQSASPGAFCHNVWISDDANYIYTTDEISNGFIGEYSISDFSNIQLTDQIQANPGTDVIPHNTHFLNDYIVTSYYTSGIQIHDVSRKGNMVSVGSFDTSPNYSGDGFNGCWGVYPWLPSGLIIASDIEEGIFVLEPDYKRGAYLEGIVREASSFLPINGVEVELLGQNEMTSTTTIGEYTMGCVDSGAYDVVFSHPLYQDDTVYNVMLVNNIVTQLDHQMYSLTPLNFTLETKEAGSLSLIEGVKVHIVNQDFSYSGITDQNGAFNVSNLIPGSYDVFAGKWGFKDYCLGSFNIVDASAPMVILLESGYQDRFNVDQGWTVEATAPSGLWVREEPVATVYQNDTCNSGSDSEDCGELAFITGNAGGMPTADDIDLGYVKLISPAISLDSTSTHYLHFSIWWKNIGGGTTPDDSLQIWAKDGDDSVQLFMVNSTNGMEWVDTTLVLSNSIDKSSFHIEVIAADWQQGVDHLVEAGIDNFLINESLLAIDELNYLLEDVLVYPNPTLDGWVELKGINQSYEYVLYNSMGQLVSKGKGSKVLLPKKGVYLIQIETNNSVLSRTVIY